MSTKTPKNLYSGPDYPKRPSFFANRFKRTLTRVGAARRVGLLGYFVLSYIAEVEDTLRYSEAPLFWISEFVDRAGRNRNAIADAIKKCRELGWLYWKQENDRTQAVAWVTVPVQYEHFLESSLSHEERLMLQLVQENRADNVADNLAQSMAGNLAQRVARNLADNIAPSSLIPDPIPIPTPPPKDGGAGGSVLTKAEEDELAGELKSLGIKKPVEAVRAGLSKITLQQFRSHLDHFRSKPGAWGPVILYLRLVSPSLHLLAPDEGWPVPLPAASNAASREAENRRQAAQQDAYKAQTAKSESTTQLLIDWERKYGPTLDAMPESDLLELCPVGVRSSLQKYGRKYEIVRNVLLKVLADMAG